MKNLLTLAFLGAAISLSSCSSKKEDPKPPVDPIVTPPKSCMLASVTGIFNPDQYMTFGPVKFKYDEKGRIIQSDWGLPVNVTYGDNTVTMKTLASNNNVIESRIYILDKNTQKPKYALVSTFMANGEPLGMDSVSFVYDNQGRLLREVPYGYGQTSTQRDSTVYTYDQNGNISEMILGGEKMTYTYTDKAYSPAARWLGYVPKQFALFLPFGDEVKNNIKHITISQLRPRDYDKLYTDLEYSYVYDKWGTRLDTVYMDYKMINGTTGRCHFNIENNCK
ncbi:hypothetical protein CLV59_103376 [Chitinophaga dinghuensis]|uniref:Uncharacterized protein n=1 Tax=Chitinophaga dinghuensis TaxID=1539050 RepID=A0A327W2D3_9BACT|nr:hypothetical protein [Chitinophaga dinghuensis]RAJ83409.1 hypothetical protein CLV59_103376 [Chitinophaga dinghuensis]